MDSATKMALMDSIDHWRENSWVDYLHHASTDSRDCALCKLFSRSKIQSVGDCNDCPIYKATGEIYCHGTPYYDAARAHELNDLDSFRYYAKKELRFLQSLVEAE